MRDVTTTDRPHAAGRERWYRRAWRWIEAPPVAGPPLTRRQLLLVLAGFALVVMMRLPLAWVHGRLQDEEGTIFLAYAWHQPALDALFRPFAGYLNLGANAVPLLAVHLVRAGVLSLESVPYLTMTTALLVQLVPALLLLTARPPWLADRRALVAALLVIAASPLTEEVFLNTLHIQFHLALAAAIVLALDVPASRFARLGYAVPVFLAPLCGPGAIILLPLFGLRALVDRSRARLAQTAVLAAGAAVQMGLFFSQSTIRGDHPDLATLAAMLFVRLSVLPLLMPPLARVIDRVVYDSCHDGTVFRWIAVVGAIGYFGVLLRAALRDRRDPAVWLIGAGLFVGAVSFGRGMIVSDPREWFSVGAAERYDFLPLVLIGLGVIALAARPAGRHRRVFVVLCVLMGVSGLFGYLVPIKEFRQGVAWPAEVAAWRLDHRHPLATWPREWTADLSDDDRPCAPGPPTPNGAEPSYCEGAWLERVRAAVQRAHAIARPR